VFLGLVRRVAAIGFLLQGYGWIRGPIRGRVFGATVAEACEAALKMSVGSHGDAQVEASLEFWGFNAV